MKCARRKINGGDLFPGSREADYRRRVVRDVKGEIARDVVIV